MITLPADTPRRLAPSVIIILALAAVMAVALPAPTAYADYCEVIGCWRECRPVPGGRWCRRICRRRCWRPAPRYVPRPTPDPHYTPKYVAPSYAPAPARSPDPVPALIMLGGMVLIGVLVIAAVASAGTATDAVNGETAETERETAETRALVAKLEAAAREADAHLDRFLTDTRHHPR